LGEAREDRRGKIKEPPERSEPYAGFFVPIALSVHRRNLKIRDYFCLKIYYLL
jgi:hypothetical protein